MRTRENVRASPALFYQINWTETTKLPTYYENLNEHINQSHWKNRWRENVRKDVTLRTVSIIHDHGAAQ